MKVWPTRPTRPTRSRRTADARRSFKFRRPPYKKSVGRVGRASAVRRPSAAVLVVHFPPSPLLQIQNTCIHCDHSWPQQPRIPLQGWQRCQCTKPGIFNAQKSQLAQNFTFWCQGNCVRGHISLTCLEDHQDGQFQGSLQRLLFLCLQLNKGTACECNETATQKE